MQTRSAKVSTETGYVEGRNLAIEYRWAEGQYDRLPTLAADLVRQRVTVIVAGANPSAVAAKAATTTIPIVFWVNSDPVTLGLVASFNHPGQQPYRCGHVKRRTRAKALGVMHELVPAATTVARSSTRLTPVPRPESKAAQVAARTLGLQLHVLEASSERGLDTAFATLTQLRAGRLVISSDAFFVGRSEQHAALALRHAVPTIFQYREFAAAGGLMSYGGNITDAIRLAGVYAGRILKDESRPTCRCSRRRRSNCSSTSGPPGRSGSLFPARCSAALTR